MESAHKGHIAIEVVGKTLALLVAALCSVITVWVLGFIHFPAPYLIEMVVLSTAAAAVTITGAGSSANLTSIAAGATLAFSILTAVSAGFYYLPVAALLLITASLTTLRTRRSGLVTLALAIAAGVVQVIIMLAVIGIQQSTLTLHG
jgi:hypothetical protein